MDDHEFIRIEGARTHNLKNLTLDIPKDRIVVFTGLSGAGKSSLVFDTIHTEAQRQLVETFSSFARRRLPKLSRPPVDDIRNLSTSIVIDQKSMGKTLRSTVGTATEIHSYLRMLYFRFGSPFIGPSFYFSFNNPEGMCPECSGLGKHIKVDTEAFLDRSKSLREGAITHPDYKVGAFFWREFMVMDLFDPDKKLADYTEEELRTLLYSAPRPVEKRHGAGTYIKNFEGVIRRLERYYVNKAKDETPEGEKNVYDSYLRYGPCSSCSGTRLNPRALSVRVGGKTIAEACAFELGDFDAFLAAVDAPGSEALVAKMRRMTGHLLEIGAGYLSLDRSVATLSGGESQRVKTARQLDSDLTGLMYILDEPSAGLHPMDGERLLYSGEVSGIVGRDTPTGRALAGGRGGSPRARRPWKEAYEIVDAWANNLKGVSVPIPKGIFTCVTGLAGSGKSSLVHEVFDPAHAEAVVVDQGPIGRTSRGTVASYVGVFDLVRKELAKALRTDAGLFSFNSKGACPKCGGSGFLSIEMNFLDDVRMTCDECGGKRYKDEVPALKYRGRDISEMLGMTGMEAREFFEGAEIKRRIGVLCDVGLGYLQIGQSLSSLSGGESQRLKLAEELRKSGNIYVMDEPTSGLHAEDRDRLLGIVDRLVEGGNTVLVIEHDLAVMAAAD